MLCMNPLDLLKIKFQVTTKNPSGTLGKHIWYSLRDIHQQHGWKGLYRGIGPNIAGNASSWGLYFLLCASLFVGQTPLVLIRGSYNMLKKRASGGDVTQSLSAGSYLLCSAQASSQCLPQWIRHFPSSLTIV